MNKLTYTRLADSVIAIDLQNGYTVIALYGWHKGTYYGQFLLKDNQIDNWHLIEKLGRVPFGKANYNTICSAILKYVANLLDENFFDYYIKRYKYEVKCFEVGNEYFEKERLGSSSVS
ncbi:hypothetical protein [uncultured Thomasclavelia sp.]|uniref:hypothetical protein n=1 Tax=uncultured Thomasclavelia sp. TaxID=3025759 RepID=UPI00280C0FD6|nr:hypothetical protein [uncultured Thomasclavelia sp.]